MTDTTTMTHEQLVEALHESAETHDMHVRAATELLLNDGFWLKNEAFVNAAVKITEDGAYIRWRDAKDARVRGEFTACTTQLGLLDLALTLGGNDFKFSRMDTPQSVLCLAAVAAALGLDFVPMETR